MFGRKRVTIDEAVDGYVVKFEEDRYDVSEEAMEKVHIAATLAAAIHKAEALLER